MPETSVSVIAGTATNLINLGSITQNELYMELLFKTVE